MAAEVVGLHASEHALFLAEESRFLVVVVVGVVGPSNVVVQFLSFRQRTRLATKELIGKKKKWTTKAVPIVCLKWLWPLVEEDLECSVRVGLF